MLRALQNGLQELNVGSHQINETHLEHSHDLLAHSKAYSNALQQLSSTNVQVSKVCRCDSCQCEDLSSIFGYT